VVERLWATTDVSSFLVATKKLKIKRENMKHEDYDVMQYENGRPIKMWTKGVPVEDEAKKQLANTSRMPFIYKHIAVMPDVHLGKGSTIGSVIPTLGAVIPAAVGVDIGCGMMAAKTTLHANDNHTEDKQL